MSHYTNENKDICHYIEENLRYMSCYTEETLRYMSRINEET
jgi:hypothetical protein